MAFLDEKYFSLIIIDIYTYIHTNIEQDEEVII